MDSAPLISRRNVLKGTSALLGSVVVGGLFKSESIQIRRQTIYLPKWDAEGFRLVFISDIHVNSPRQFARGMEAVRLVLNEKVDLIAFGGDFIDSHEELACRHLNILGAKLHEAKSPIVGIFGNHDCFVGEDKMTDLLRASPIIILKNSVYEMGGVSVVGLDDAMFGTPDPSILSRGGLTKSVIALWHEPDLVEKTPQTASIQLSGHSHGGEICLPGGVAIHTPELAKNYTAGFYPSARVPLYVSKGVATVGPCRLYCPPEISVLTFRSSGGSGPRMEG